MATFPTIEDGVCIGTRAQSKRILSFGVHFWQFLALLAFLAIQVICRFFEAV